MLLDLGLDEEMERTLAVRALAHVINSMLDESLPLTVGEFEEWGNPKIREQYEYMKSYCPYTNLGERAYPAILVKTSLNDSQVMYWEPAKYVAKMRALTAGPPRPSSRSTSTPATAAPPAATTTCARSRLITRG